MSIQKELEDLIKNDVLIEIEDYIDELFEIIAAKKTIFAGEINKV